MSSEALSGQAQSDGRIPVRIGDAALAGPGSYVVFAADLPRESRGHAFGCACCAPRGALARTLARLHLARVRGDVAYFHEVILAGGFDQSALDTALSQDVVVAARFRAG